MLKPKLGEYAILVGFEERTAERIIGEVVRKPLKKPLARNRNVGFWYRCCSTSDVDSWRIGETYVVYAGAWRNITIISEKEAKRLLMLEAL